MVNRVPQLLRHAVRIEPHAAGIDVELWVRPDPLLGASKLEQARLALLFGQQRDHCLGCFLHRFGRCGEAGISDALIEAVYECAVCRDALERLRALARKLIAEPGDRRNRVNLALCPALRRVVADPGNLRRQTSSASMRTLGWSGRGISSRNG